MRAKLLLTLNSGQKVQVYPTIPTTLVDNRGTCMGMILSDGNYVEPCDTNVGKIIDVWNGFEKVEMQIVWDGAVPEKISRGTKGHSKGLLLDDYQVPGEVRSTMLSEEHPNWAGKGRLKK